MQHVLFEPGIMKIYEKDFVDIHEMPDLPGIYAWYVTPNNKEELQCFLDIFGSSHIKIEGKGRFNESFKGHLRSKSLQFDRSVNLYFLKSVLRGIASPIYIGISKQSLLVRLEQHKTLITAYLCGTSSKLSKNFVDEDEKASNVFAKRIADKIRDSDSKISEINLFVRAIVMPEDLTPTDLVNIEFFLNRSIKPILGSN